MYSIFFIELLELQNYYFLINIFEYIFKKTIAC
jgi:hypothetical protein